MSLSPENRPSSPAAASTELPPGFTITLAALWTGNLFAPFLSSSVNAILPAMGSDLNATAVHLSLVMVVYAMAQAIFNIVGGRVSDIWGRRRVLLIGVGLFTFFSVGMGLAPTIGSMLGLRFCQGGAAAVVSTCTTAIAISLAPLSHRGRVMGILTSAVYLGLTLGPLIGGLVATVAGWRWQFLGVCVPGLVVWAVLRRSLRQEWRAAAGEKLDMVGLVLFMAGLGLIVTGAGCLGLRRELAWLILPGVLLLALFVRQQLRATYPILDFRLLGQTEGLTTGLLAMFINYGSTMGLVFFFSLYLQEVRGMSAFAAGSMLITQSMAQMVASPLGGRLADRLGAERVSAAGMVLCGLGILGVAMLGKQTPLALLVVSQIFLGVGIGIFNAPNVVATLSYVDAKHLAVASGLMNSMRSMGGLFSQVLISLIIGHYMGRSAVTAENADTFLVAMRTTLTCLAVLNLCGVCVGLRRAVHQRR